jgi:hypothetical protein
MIEPHSNGIWTGIARIGWCTAALVAFAVPLAILVTLSVSRIIAGCVGVLMLGVFVAIFGGRRRLS